MAQKSWKIKLVLTDDDARAMIAQAIDRWNDGVRRICLALLAMRRGEFGDSGRDVWAYVSRRNENYHALYWITDEPQPEKDKMSDDVREKREITGAFRAEHGIHPGLREARMMLGCLWKHAIKAAVQRIKSYHAHIQLWHDERTQWEQERAEWQRDHPEYMRLRPLVEAFNEQHGKTAGRWNRWHKWIAFLTRPEIVAWQDENETLVPLTDEELRECRKNRRRAVAREVKLLFKKNPQLERFNKLNRDYERNFVRFKRAPTFTLPALPNRPDWPRFQGNEGWRNLNVQQRTVDLYVPDIDDAGKSTWLTVPFVPDPRIKRLRPLREPYKPGKRERFDYEWVNHLGQPTFAQPQGIKLIRRGDSFYASISFTVHPIDSPVPISQTRLNKVSKPAPYLRKVLEEKSPDAEIITCAIDLAVRHLGAATVARNGEVFARRLLHHRFHLPGVDREHAINIPTLHQLADAKRALGRARSKTGGVRRGDRDFRKLRERYRNLKDDRIKKSVAALFQFAVHHGAHVVIFEDLKSLRPDAALDRGLNRAMQRWNRGAMVQLAGQLAEDYGLRVVTVGAGYTSRVCGRCAGLGVRFDQGERRPRNGEKSAPIDRHAIRLNRLGHWFYCPNCRRRVHADLNASENLHRVFLGDWPIKPAKGGCAIEGKPVLYADVERAAIESLGVSVPAK